MRFITTNDIEVWANTVDCKYHLPHLVRQLILATIDNNDIKNIQFPYGEDVQTGGFDGELISESENMFVPLGESVWEFGTTNAKGKKANEDYEKRKGNPLGKNPSETTYINVNAKKYRDKNRWVEEKQTENFWKDIKYLDAIDIEQWLELAPAVELWLAEKLRKPTLGIYTAEEYWKRWSENESIKIVPEILLGDSRLNESEKVKSFLSNDEKVLYIKSITTEEATAFPLAIFKLSDSIPKISIIIIDNKESFNQFTLTTKPLIVLAKFKIESVDLIGAIQKGHKVIVPISLAEDINTSEKIQLPIVSRDTFEQGLKKMGIDSEQARILTKSSGRNISILKRLLKFHDSTQPKYLDSVEISDVIPILLVNRFAEYLDGDKEIIEKISGKSSDDYIKFLRILVALEDSPVYYINGVWRLISPTDAWLFFAKYITQQELANFRDTCMEVLSEVLHKYTLPLKSRGNLYQPLGNRTKYSSEIREGICETIVAISVFGENYGIASVSNVSFFVDNIIQKILEMDVVIWRSLSRDLKLLAEASPNIFLSNLERIIKDGTFSSFFEVEEGFMSSSNDLAPVLWCLDVIGWFPEHLMRVSNILCEIIAISPENFPTANTPLSSLKSIYRTWYPQTNTSAEDRKKILKLLIKKYPDTIYNLLYQLVDSRFDTAFHTPRPKWRLFSELREIQVTQREVHYMRGFCIDNIIDMSKGDIKNILRLIDLLDNMDCDRINTVLSLIEDNTSNLNNEDKKEIYHHFRKFVGNHRSYPTANWSLPTDILDKIEQTALKFKLEDDILNDSYLFEEHHPEFIEGKEGHDFRKHNDEILLRRIEFVDAVIKTYGIDKIFDLALKTEYPYLYGNILSFSKEISKKDKYKIYNLVESTDQKLITLATNFINVSENNTGLQAQIDVLDMLIKSGTSEQGTVRFLTALSPNINLWKLINESTGGDIDKLYWQSQKGFLFTDSKGELFYALDKLLQYNQPVTYINTLGWGTYVYKNILSSEEVLSALEKVSFENSTEDSSFFDNHKFKNVIDFLYSRNDYDIERGAKVDVKFIFAFSGGSYSPVPKNLFKLMSNNPNEYFNILSLVYLPFDDELREIELNKIKENSNYKAIFEASFKILDNFNLIPSLKEDGSLDIKELKYWISQVRELASNNDREKVADFSIGKLLAKYPIDMVKEIGFPIEIYDIIEELGTDDIKKGFELQIFNNLGFTSRGAFEGGNIERFRANFFKNLFDEIKYTHPSVASIFKTISDNYLSQAKREDDRALLDSL